jgi:hypothetical protein
MTSFSPRAASACEPSRTLRQEARIIEKNWEVPAVRAARFPLLPFEPAVDPSPRYRDSFLSGPLEPNDRRPSHGHAGVRKIDHHGPFIPAKASTDDVLDTFVGVCTEN